MPSSRGSFHLGIEPRSPTLQADSFPAELLGKPSTISSMFKLLQLARICVSAKGSNLKLYLVTMSFGVLQSQRVSQGFPGNHDIETLEDNRPVI